MVRSLFLFSVFALGLCLLSEVDGAQKKKIDTSTFGGKITDVNVNETSKKVESIFVEWKRGQKRNAPIDDKTKIEYVGFKDKGDEKLQVGQIAEVKMDTASNAALSIKVTATATTPKKTKKT